MGMKLISDILLGVGGWRWLGFEVGGCGLKVGGGRWWGLRLEVVG